MLAQAALTTTVLEEAKVDEVKAMTGYFFNSDSSPLQAFREVPTSGTGSSGLYFSEEMVGEEWFQELRRLSHKRSLSLFASDTCDGPSPRFSGLTDLAEITNKYIAQKLTKNNFKRVHLRF